MTKACTVAIVIMKTNFYRLATITTNIPCMDLQSLFEPRLLQTAAGSRTCFKKHLQKHLKNNKYLELPASRICTSTNYLYLKKTTKQVHRLERGHGYEHATSPNQLKNLKDSSYNDVMYDL